MYKDKLTTLTNINNKRQNYPQTKHVNQLNYLNYAKHIIYKPDMLHRRFEFDLPQCGMEEAKRVATAALPFLTFCPGVAAPMNLVMGGVRVVGHLGEGIREAHEKNWKQCALNTSETALAVLGLSAALFNFTFGLCLTTGVDTLKGLKETSSHLYRKEYDQAFDSFIQMATSSVYLAFMTTGALECMLAFALLQTLGALYQASQDVQEKRYIEAAAKIVMASLRGKQSFGYVKAIERRNALMAIAKYQSLIAGAMHGKMARHLIEHPLNDVGGVTEANSALLSYDGKEYDFGANFHGYGKGLVKGENLIFRKIEVNGKEMMECEFKINHAFREQLEKSFKDLAKLNPSDVKEILKLTGSHAESIHIDPANLHWMWGGIDSAFDISSKVHFAGLGTVAICEQKAMINLYDKVIVRMDADKTIYDLHELLAFTGLEESLFQSTPEDIERLKVGLLFRAFFPRLASPFERKKEFFTLSLEDLKNKIIQLAPDMKEIFETCLPAMKAYEILPGRIRYRIPYISQKVRSLGGRALTAAVFGGKDLYDRIGSILSIGMISQELKDANGMNVDGLGGTYWDGGADAVYVQMLTEKNAKDKMPFNHLAYNSSVRLIISLDALDTGTYQYLFDNFGSRVYDTGWDDFGTYRDRFNIFEFTEKLQKNPKQHSGNEIMIKERLDPTCIQGIVVSDNKVRQDLINHLRSKGLVHKNHEGQETILGALLDRFIRVETSFSEDLF